MTPEARVAAAIDILDDILNNQSAERVLTTWARRNRFAGSKDRAAIRDLVFDALRCKRSFSWRAGREDGRGLMLGRTLARGEDPDEVFTGQGYAPSPLTEDERQWRPIETAPEAVQHDCQDWLWSVFNEDLGSDAAPVLRLMQSRAPVFLRVNTQRSEPSEAIARLAAEGIPAEPHALSPSALEVTDNARRVKSSRAFRDGLVELQDAASQAVVDALVAEQPQGAALDYCAGGGGKSLALAARGFQVTAHDADPNRMKDIPERAARAGVEIPLTTGPKGRFDIVLIDAPCSGSGAWRRQPEAKWTLTPDRLATLNATQDGILNEAQHLVAPGGVLAYATCSLLACENEGRIESFTAKNAGWTKKFQKKYTPMDGGDGFFIAGLRRR